MNSAPQLTAEICTIFRQWAILGQDEAALAPDAGQEARLLEASRTIAALAGVGAGSPAMLLRPSVTYESIAFLVETLQRRRRIQSGSRHESAVREWLEANSGELAAQ